MEKTTSSRLNVVLIKAQEWVESYYDKIDGIDPTQVAEMREHYNRLNMWLYRLRLIKVEVQRRYRALRAVHSSTKSRLSAGYKGAKADKTSVVNNSKELIDIGIRKEDLAGLVEQIEGHEEALKTVLISIATELSMIKDR